VVCDAYLFILQIHTGSFETGWQGEMVWHRETFHGLGAKDIIEFNSDALSFACWEKKKKKGETARRLSSHLAGCAMQDFHGC
jgi:hypothetical protein